MTASLTDIRDFIVAQFSREELNTFCHDYFRKVYEDNEGTGIEKSVYARRLLEHCERHDQIGRLLDALQRERPAAFSQRFGHDVAPTNEGGTRATSSASPGTKGLPKWPLLGVGVVVVLIAAVLYPLLAGRGLAPRPSAVEPTAAATLVMTAQGADGASTSEVSTPISTALAPSYFLTATGMVMELVFVPAGEFLMGSDPGSDENALGDEQPQHAVYLSEYYIGKHEVTHAQWDAFATATGRSFGIPQGQADEPVVNVSWRDARAFVDWLSAQSGRVVRLPTEAEWEKACRSVDGRIYPWGDPFDARKLNSREGGHGTTTPVGLYSPVGDSPYGAADMAGNAIEWTADGYDPRTYKDRVNTASPDPVRDPPGSTSEELRVVRGGSWHSRREHVRCAGRGRYPDNRLNPTSFRVVLSSLSVP